MDKWAYVYGVAVLVLTEFFLLRHPERFWMWYATLMCFMLAARLPCVTLAAPRAPRRLTPLRPAPPRYYYVKKWQYFMMDFCYFAQACNYTYLFYARDSCSLLKVCFAYALGPLGWAVIMWRNSLVFHDFDKVTTVYVHVLPAWLLVCLRHYEGDACAPWGFADFGNALAVYAAWQAAYFLKTEVVDKKKLDADPRIQTSLRWMSADTDKGAGKVVCDFLRARGVLEPGEKLNYREFKTQFIFMATQLVYTAVTFVPIPVMWRWPEAASLVTLVLCATTAYNGGAYYIEIFSRRYARQFGTEYSGEAPADENADSPDHSGQSSGAEKGGGTKAAGAGAVQGGGGARRRRKQGKGKAAGAVAVGDEEQGERCRNNE